VVDLEASNLFITTTVIIIITIELTVEVAIETGLGHVVKTITMSTNETIPVHPVLRRATPMLKEAGPRLIKSTPDSTSIPRSEVRCNNYRLTILIFLCCLCHICKGTYVDYTFDCNKSLYHDLCDDVNNIDNSNIWHTLNSDSCKQYRYLDEYNDLHFEVGWGDPDIDTGNITV
jgi:hypothetical protein